MDRIKSQLSKEFEMKDLEFLTYYMVIEVARSSLGIKSLKGNTRPAKKTGTLGSKPAETSMVANVKLEVKDDCLMVDK